MTTIVEFLQQRYDEIEAAARTAIGEVLRRSVVPKDQTNPEYTAKAQHWKSGPYAIVGKHAVTVDLGRRYDRQMVMGPKNSPLPTHIALHDPAYVLADITAKRRILEQRSAITEELQYASTEAQHNLPMIVHAGLELDKVIKQLAAPFDQHPDYQEEWTP